VLFEEPAQLSDCAGLTPPTPILCGDQSPGPPSRRSVESLDAVMPQSRIGPLPGAGHKSPLTHVEAVNPAIRNHLQRTADNPGRCAA